jgi:hypothetical protein
MRRQKQFSNKSILLVALTIFTELVVLLMMPSPPVLVFVLAENINGTPGDDTLNGTDEADTINGFDGNDIIFGEGGDDTLDGGDGGDEIYGGDGNDEIKDPDDEDSTNKVYGGSGDDNIDVGTVTGTGVTYYIYGEDGSDYIEVIANEGIVDGGLDDDTIYCTADYCAINGNEGDDEIHTTPAGPDSSAQGGSGNDKLYDTVGYELQGNDGNDYLYGGGVMYGGAEDDILEGTHPDTQYYGGAGADTFQCSSTWEHDTVHDYNPAEGDQIVSVADCETVEGDIRPSDVEITQAVDKKGSEIIHGSTTNSRYIKITFEITKGEAGEITKIECSLDGQAFTSCTSPVTYDKLKKGTHEFTVRVWDAAYARFVEDEFTWTIGKPPLP